ncbi:MAG: hypothetical protein RO257_10570 [Candidatus Kapabacteria bacterium]|nr:hypothetical protein [Candidatus Kapabacteria bacterium]
MKHSTIILLMTFVFTFPAFSQKYDPNIDYFKKIRIIGEFLKEEFDVLPGDQLYKAQDLWEGLGSKKIKIEEPLNPKSKDFIKNVAVNDVAELVSGYRKFYYQGKNETIESMTISTDLEKGDILIGKFIEKEGQYEPTATKSNSIEFIGTYTFDDFIIRVTEYSKDEKMEFVITKNLAFRNIKR